MIEIRVKRLSGEEETIQADSGDSVMEALIGNGVDEIQALCGGALACATCHVYVEPEHKDKLPEMGEDEEALLEMADNRTDNSRLSCQIPVTEDIEGLLFEVAPED
jgi:2Fe-2S ferredoxin